LDQVKGFTYSNDICTADTNHNGGNRAHNYRAKPRSRPSNTQERENKEVFNSREKERQGK